MPVGTWCYQLTATKLLISAITAGTGWGSSSAPGSITWNHLPLTIGRFKFVGQPSLAQHQTPWQYLSQLSGIFWWSDSKPLLKKEHLSSQAVVILSSSGARNHTIEPSPGCRRVVSELIQTWKGHHTSDSFCTVYTQVKPNTWLFINNFSPYILSNLFSKNLWRFRCFVQDVAECTTGMVHTLHSSKHLDQIPSHFLAFSIFLYWQIKLSSCSENKKFPFLPLQKFHIIKSTCFPHCFTRTWNRWCQPWKFPEVSILFDICLSIWRKIIHN